MNKYDITQMLKKLLPHERCDHENDKIADGEGYIGCRECELKRLLRECVKDPTKKDLTKTHDDIDERHSIPITVVLLDTVTGITRKGVEGYSTYWWTEGNGSCDCNRRLSFQDAHDEESSTLCLTERYRVVSVTPLLDGYSLEDFNEGYK